MIPAYIAAGWLIYLFFFSRRRKQEILPAEQEDFLR